MNRLNVIFGRKDCNVRCLSLKAELENGPWIGFGHSCLSFVTTSNAGTKVPRVLLTPYPPMGLLADYNCEFWSAISVDERTSETPYETG